MNVVHAVTLWLALSTSAAAFSLKKFTQQLKSHHARPKTSDAPSFCHGLECPGYGILGYLNSTEIRRYDASTWVSTNISDVSYDKALNVMFWRLFKYISGANKDGVKIEMTAPVKVRLIPSQGPFCESKFVMSFFVSNSFQGKPPAPTSEDVYIDHVPETTYFVTSFGGFARESKVVRHATELVEGLEDAGYKFNKHHFFSAGYDSPFRLTDRHNEIWVESIGSDF